MRHMRAFLYRGEAQSLIEASLLLPLLLLLAFNAVNLGYVFYSYLNMATASRQGAEYSIQGLDTIQGGNLPTAAQVDSLVSEDIASAVPSGGNAPVRVCTQSLGLNTSYTGANQIPLCSTYAGSAGGSGSFPASDPNCTGTPICPDPEAADGLILNRIDVQYTVGPLVDGMAFNMIVPTLTYHRYVYMRAIN